MELVYAGEAIGIHSGGPSTPCRALLPFRPLPFLSLQSRAFLPLPFRPLHAEHSCHFDYRALLPLPFKHGVSIQTQREPHSTPSIQTQSGEAGCNCTRCGVASRVGGHHSCGADGGHHSCGADGGHHSCGADGGAGGAIARNSYHYQVLCASFSEHLTHYIYRVHYASFFDPRLLFDRRGGGEERGQGSDRKDRERGGRQERGERSEGGGRERGAEEESKRRGRRGVHLGKLGAHRC